MEIKAKFEACSKHLQNLPKEGPYKPNTSVKLKYYSWYKQATEGPCSQPQPPFYNFVARAKWEAWKSLGNMKPEEAMQLYICEYTELLGKYKSFAPPF